MDHIKALIIKYAMVSIVVVSLFNVVYGQSFNYLLLSLVLTVVAYIVGDLFILPRFGDFVAIIGDFALAFIIIALSSVIFFEVTFLYMIISASSALLIASGEFLFHYYVQNVVLDARQDIYKQHSKGGIEALNTRLSPSYATEFANEIDVHHDITEYYRKQLNNDKNE